MDKKLLTITIALIILAIAVAPVTAARIANQLPTPNLVSPKNNVNLYGQPTTVLLQWKPVDDERLKEYKVELQGYYLPYGVWGKITLPIPDTTTNTYFQLDALPEGYDYRWRVTAISNIAGFDSAPSSWRYFSFRNPDTLRLATPRVQSPANNIQVGVGMPLTYNWNPVPGAFDYGIYQEQLVDGVWVHYTYREVLSENLPMTTDYFTHNPGTFRWHVVALSSDPYTVSEPSPWRTLTVFE